MDGGLRIGRIQRDWGRKVGERGKRLRKRSRGERGVVLNIRKSGGVRGGVRSVEERRKYDETTC